MGGSEASAGSVPLTRVRPGQSGVVCAVGDDDLRVLGPMGLRERSSVRVCRGGEPCIVEVGCAPGMCRRIGLSRAVASRVMVRIESQAG